MVRGCFGTLQEVSRPVRTLMCRHAWDLAQNSCVSPDRPSCISFVATMLQVAEISSKLQVQKGIEYVSTRWVCAHGAPDFYAGV
jgi:hypothetical protein